MSQTSETTPEAKKSSHNDSEPNSKLETELEEGSMASEDDTSFLFGFHHRLISTHPIFITGTFLMPKEQESI